MSPLLRLLLLILLCLPPAYPSFAVELPNIGDPAERLVTPEQERQLGEAFMRRLRQSVPFIDDPELDAYLGSLGSTLVANSDDPGQRFTFFIVNDDAINAFAAPGGFIGTHSALFLAARNESELAGVLAHEIAHIEHNHIMKNVIRQIGAGIFFDVVFGGAGAGQAIAIASVNLAGLRYSRGDETDADSRGMDYLDAAGISTGGIASMFERFQDYEENAGVSDIPTMLSSHPASRERADAARTRARQGLEPSLTEREWRIVQQACGGADTVSANDEEAPAAD